MSKYIELNNNLETLKLTKIIDLLPNVLNDANMQNKSFVDILYELTNSEIKYRDDRARKINITVSSFPYLKTINDFDFTYQPTINKQQILDLSTLRFMETKENVIFMGLLEQVKHILQFL